MSLDVHLTIENKIKKKPSSGIFIRENGQTKEITEEEWRQRFPDREPVRVTLEEIETNEVYSSNITHNLGTMADKAGIYYALWRPEEKGWKQAKDIIPVLEKGLKKLKSKSKYFEKFNAPNGWGIYEHFVPFVEEYLNACKEYPDAIIDVSR